MNRWTIIAALTGLIFGYTGIAILILFNPKGWSSDQKVEKA